MCNDMVPLHCHSTTADPIDPGDIKPVSNIFPESAAEELRPEVAVCGAMSLLVQVIFEPLKTADWIWLIIHFNLLSCGTFSYCNRTNGALWVTRTPISCCRFWCTHSQRLFHCTWYGIPLDFRIILSYACDID